MQIISTYLMYTGKLFDILRERLFRLVVISIFSYAVIYFFVMKMHVETYCQLQIIAVLSIHISHILYISS